MRLLDRRALWVMGSPQGLPSLSCSHRVLVRKRARVQKLGKELHLSLFNWKAGARVPDGRSPTPLHRLSRARIAPGTPRAHGRPASRSRATLCPTSRYGNCVCRAPEA